MSASPGKLRAADEPHRLSAQVKRIGDRSERCGAVEIARYEKNDGRSLLLYRHRGEQDS